jgi:tetrahydromethanopterin S-methyltransferase subunit B
MKNTQAKYLEKIADDLIKKLDSKEKTLDALQKNQDKVVLEFKKKK